MGWERDGVVVVSFFCFFCFCGLGVGCCCFLPASTVPHNKSVVYVLQQVAEVRKIIVNNNVMQLWPKYRQ